MPHTEISSIGEFGLIEHIRKIVDIKVEDTSLHENLVIGISDDSAVFKPTPGKYQLLTADTFAEGIHFDLTFTPFNHLGWKVIVANISDIIAMGGIPRYATVSLSLPKKISVEMVEKFYEGAAAACKKYFCLVVGGDTTASMTNMIISVAMVGEANEKQIKYRKDAKPGHYLCVSGHLGASIAGLKVLKREKEQFARSSQSFKPNLEPYTLAVEKHLMPKPQLQLAKILVSEINIGAMIDISDGLASEVHHLCKNSGVGALVYEHNIPLLNVTQKIAGEFSDSPINYALYGGEEYELLFTVSDGEYEKLERKNTDVTIIGRITDKSEGVVLVCENGDHKPLSSDGWNHFRR